MSPFAQFGTFVQFPFVNRLHLGDDLAKAESALAKGIRM